MVREPQRIIIHDVLQYDHYSPLQKKSVKRRGDFFNQFKDFMDIVGDFPVTLLVVAEGIDKNPEWVKWIKDRNLKVELHGWDHRSYSKYDPELIRDYLKRGKEKIEQTFGQKVTMFFPPKNKFNQLTKDICTDLGIDQREAYFPPGRFFRKGFPNRQWIDFHFWTQGDNWLADRLFHYKNVYAPHFIVGAPRSGTTALLKYEVSKNPNAVYLKEVENIWRRGQPPVYQVYSKMLEEQGKTEIIDKNARNSLRLPIIKKMFPDARFTHIIRDGRAVANSWHNYAIRVDKTDQTIDFAAYQWRHYVGYIQRQLKAWKRCETVRYEDLCEQNDYFVSRNNKWENDLNAKEKRIVLKIQQRLLKDLEYVL